MPKTAALIALVLMLLTGLAIGNLNTLHAPAPVAEAIPVASAATSRTAVAFYDAIDQLLDTGDSSDLRRIVHPNFVDHSHVSTEPGAIESLETYLLSVRASSPDLRFAVTEVVAQNDLIAVELDQTGAAESNLAGLTVTFPSVSSGYELLRIKNALVTERWASPTLPGLIEPSVARLDGLENASWIREPRIERLKFTGRASLEVNKHKGTILIVESGSLNLSIPEQSAPMGSESPAGPAPSSTNVPEKLVAGTIRVIPPDTRFHVWNSSQAGATVIALTVLQMEPADYYSTKGNDDIVVGEVSRQQLAGGATIRPDHGPFQLVVGHAVAAPGTTIAQHGVNELELLFVTHGTVEATLRDGFVFSLAEFSGLKTENDIATVGPDQAISAGFGTELAYEVAGQEPAEFWLITITPEE